MGTRSRVCFRMIIGMLGVLLAAPGCASHPKSEPTPDLTTARAHTASSARPTDVEPPEKPAAMENPDEAGAVAAAEYFLRLTAYAAATGSIEGLEGMSSEYCEACREFVATPMSFHEDGGWSDMPSVRIESAVVELDPNVPDRYQVELEATRSGYDYYTRDDGATHAGSETLKMGFVVAFRGRWQIDFVQASSAVPNG